ncbi:MAG: hypothetical protein PHF25_04375, partial [Candidatus Margulisbacteria bacterium]|nr:hypothetical protein [Candidatus Margulisiibacteriota bacterium]
MDISKSIVCLLLASCLFSTTITIDKFELYDQDTLLTEQTDDQVVGISISTDLLPTKYLISEDRPTKPISSDTFWETEKPTRYTFKNDSNEIKTVYLYVMSSSGDISEGAVATINLDSSYPQISSVSIFQSLVELSAGYTDGSFHLREGPFNVTFSFTEALRNTPSILLVNNSEQIITTFSLLKVDDRTFIGSFLVTAGITEGVYWINYSCTDNTGYETNGASFVAGKIIIDHTSPNLQTFALDGKDPTLGMIYSNTRYLPIQIEPNDASGIRGWIVTDNVDYTPTAVSSWRELGSYLVLTNNIAVHYITFWYIDNAWNINYSTANISYDPQTPEVSVQVDVIPNSFVANQQILITLDISNVGSGLSDTPNLSYSAPNKPLRSLPLQLLVPGKYRATFNVSTYTGEGQGFFAVRATDNEHHVFADNIVLWYQGVSYDPFYIVSHDLKTPSFYMYDQDTFLSRDANDQIVGITITDDEQAVAWHLSEIRITPSVGSELWLSVKPGSYTFKNDSEGTKIVYLWMKDGVGRISQVSIATINYDLTNPDLDSVDLVNSESGIVSSMGGYYYLKVGTYNITFNFDVDITITPTIWLENGSVTEVLEVTRVTDRGYTAEYVVTVGSAEGTYSINYSATDNAGNLVKSQKLEVKSLVVDVSKPTVNFEILDLDTLSDLYTNSRNVRLSINVEEENILGYYVTENFSPFTINYSLFTDYLPITFNITSANNGAKQVIILVLDKAGNISSASYAITMDTQAPTAIIELSVDPSYINIGEYRITLNVGGVVSGLVATPSLMFVANGTLPLNLPLERETDNQYLATLSITTFTGDGVGYFLFSATDNANNSANGIKPPLGGLGAGASSVYVSTDINTVEVVLSDPDSENSDYSNDQKVHVTIRADEQAKYWLLKEENITPSVTSNLWVVTRPGEYTFKNTSSELKNVYLWIKNANGVISQRTLATINYDDVYPELSAIAIADTSSAFRLSSMTTSVTAIEEAYYLKVGTYNVTFNFNEEMIVTPTIWLENGSVTEVVTEALEVTRVTDRTYTTEYVVTSGTTEGSYSINYSATDNAGNKVVAHYYEPPLGGLGALVVDV